MKQENYAERYVSSILTETCYNNGNYELGVEEASLIAPANLSSKLVYQITRMYFALGMTNQANSFLYNHQETIKDLLLFDILKIYDDLISSDFKSAKAKIEKKQSQLEGDSDGLIVCGVFEKVWGNKEKAQFYFKKSIQINPKNADAYTNLGHYHLQNTEYDLAIKYFSRALKIKPYHSKTRDLLVKAMFSANLLTELRDILDDWTNDNGSIHKKKYLRNLTEICEKLDQPQLKLQYLLKLIDKDEADLKVIMYAAVTYVDLEKVSEALRLLNSFATTFSESIEFNHLRGVCYSKIGDHRVALLEFKKAEELGANSVEFLNNIGNCCYKLGDIFYAKKYLNAALSYDDSSLTVNNSLLTISISEKDFSCAISIVKKIENLDVRLNASFILNRGNLNYQMGQIDAALTDYLSILKLGQEGHIAYVNAYRCAAQLQDKRLIDKLNYIMENQLDFKDWCNENIVLITLKLILSYVMKESKNISRFLKQLEEFKKTDRWGKLNQSDLIFCNGYIKFISKLMERPRSRLFHQNERVCLHIGDSHSLTFAHQEIKVGGHSYLVNPSVIFGCKAFHLGSRNTNSYSELVKRRLKNSSQFDVILVSIGEIDCRIDEGIITVTDGEKDNTSKIIESTVERFVQFFSKIRGDKDLHISFTNVPAPVFSPVHSKEKNLQRLRIIREFNSTLEKEVSKILKFSVTDLYEITSDKSGFSNNRYHCDDFHLLPEVLVKK